MNPIIINTQALCDGIIGSINNTHYISLDTEFFRRDTYYAKLALLQIAIDEEIYIVDATLVDIKSLWNAIATSNALKIIHSGRQDLEIMFHLFGALPNNIFDTQIAAKFCSFRADSSYAELCQIICNVEDLNKKLQNCNWLKRPLTPAMIEYAAIDVKHLLPIYNSLNPMLIKQNLEDKFKEKTHDLLLDPEIYSNTLENAWKKIKYYKNNLRFISRLKVICAFREHAAQAFDIPRRFFLTDEQIMTMCNELPQDENMLLKISNLSSYLLQEKYKNKLIELSLTLLERESQKST